MRGRHSLGLLFFLLSTLSFASPRLFFNPISPILGNANLGIDYAISDSSSLGPELIFFNFRDGTEYLPGVGIGALWEIYIAKDVYTDSWILAPRASVFRLSKSHQSINGFLVGASLAYAWFWASGFNMKAGLGLEYSHADFEKLNFDINAFAPAGTFSIGYYY
jgi:hypothetical protein